jgi:phage terminase large subunit-like protein
VENPSDIKALEEGCYFDPDAADRAVRFIEGYVIPSTIGKPIRLLPWQAEGVVRPLFGWKRPDGRLRYRRATISTAKKSGKTVLVSSLLAYGMLGGLCPSPFVASASTSRENASQVYRELAFSIRKNKKLNALCKCLDSLKEIRCKSKDARYRAFSADAGASEGENLSLCVNDETHAHVSDRLYRSLEYSTVARADGLFINCSTAGADQGHFWYDVFKYAQGVQSGEIIDTSSLPFICTIPDEADIEDPAVWKLTNPSLGVSFSEEDFRRDYERAKAGGTADLLSFKRYRLNMWCRAEDSFIDPAKFDLCFGPVTEAELKDKPLFVGADLSQTTDPCSVSCVWALGERKYFVRSHAWVCEEGVRRREQTNLPKYRQFQAEGTMTITPGTVNDYRRIKEHIQQLRQRYNLKEVIFDQYNAIEMATELMGDGLTVFRQPQNHRHYTAPMKEFEITLNEGRLQHDGNKLLRWALANTHLDVDAMGNCKPSRDKSLDKVDPAISTLMAFGRAVEVTVMGSKPSVYEGRGIFVL